MDSPYQVQIPSTLIGAGVIDQVGTLVKRHGGSKVLIITDQGIVQAGLLEKVKKPLESEGIKFEVFDGCQPNAPKGTIEQCAKIAKEGGYDLFIALGGGSVMDTSKMAALIVAGFEDLHSCVGVNKIESVKAGVHKIMIPTTAGSGSEWSRSAVFKEESDELKYSISSVFQMAEQVIIDPELYLDLPAVITADTGMDALIHAIEAYTMIKATVISDMFAEKVMTMVPPNLRAAYAGRDLNIEARYNMAIAAPLAIAAAMSTGGGGVLIHGMAYPLRDMAPKAVTHGAACSILTPFVLEFQMITNPPRFARIAEFMGEKIEGLSSEDTATKAAEVYRKLSIDVGMPQRMRDVGLKKEDIPRLVDNVFSMRRYHAEESCRRASRDDVTRIFEAAW